MPRPQFTLRALLVLLMAVACFFGGIRFEQERRRRAEEAAALAAKAAQPDSPRIPNPAVQLSAIGQPSDVPTDGAPRAIRVARQYLEDGNKGPIRAELEATRNGDGYRVFVQDIGGYDRTGRPLYFVGGHCVVVISKDWQVSRVIGGR